MYKEYKRISVQLYDSQTLQLEFGHLMAISCKALTMEALVGVSERDKKTKKKEENIMKVGTSMREEEGLLTSFHPISNRGP